MNEAGLTIVYLIFCLLVGLCGTYRRIGFFGAFLLAFLVTPVVVVLVLAFTAPSRAAKS